MIGTETNRVREWTTEVPKLVEQLSPDTWIGQSEDGRRVVVTRVAADDPKTIPHLIEHVHNLASIRHQNLVPVLGAAEQDGAVWVTSALPKGAPVSSVLEHYPLSAAQATLVGLGVLDGVAALQRAGMNHGSLTADNVHVDRSGCVQLAGYALKPRFRPLAGNQGGVALGWADPKSDLVAAGALLCESLGIDRARNGDAGAAVAGVPAALAVTARALAAGELGRDASAARAMVADSAGLLAGPAARQQAATELGFLAGSSLSAIAEPVSRVVSDARRAARPQPAPAPAPTTPVAPIAAAPAAAAAFAGGARSARAVSAAHRRHRNWPLLAGLAAFGILLVAVFANQLHVFGYGQSTATIAPIVPAKSSAPSAAASVPAAQPAQSQPPVPAAQQPAAQPASQPAAQQAPQPAVQAVPPANPQPAATGGGSPTGAVASFYSLVQAHDFSDAAGLWSSRMQSNYPPNYYINGRFANTTGFSLRQDRLISQSGNRAAVYIDLIEYKGGTTYHWTGTWYLVNTGNGWLLDSPSLSGGQVASVSDGEAD